MDDKNVKSAATFLDKGVLVFLILFSFLKIGGFASHLFSISHVILLILNKSFVPRDEIFFILNPWVFLASIIDFLSYSLFLLYSIQTLNGLNKKGKIIRLCFLMIFFYYPFLTISNYYFIGKNSLMGLITSIIPVLILFIILLYLVLQNFLKKEIAEEFLKEKGLL